MDKLAAFPCKALFVMTWCYVNNNWFKLKRASSSYARGKFAESNERNVSFTRGTDEKSSSFFSALQVLFKYNAECIFALCTQAIYI